MAACTCSSALVSYCTWATQDCENFHLVTAIDCTACVQNFQRWGRTSWRALFACPSVVVRAAACRRWSYPTVLLRDSSVARLSGSNSAPSASHAAALPCPLCCSCVFVPLSLFPSAENESLYVPGAAIVVRNAFVQHYRDTAAGRLRGGGGGSGGHSSGRGSGPLGRPDRGFVLAVDRVSRLRACRRV